ncbi:hypothetical protein [Escherichia coli]|uniref:hypothetical protein n=1 Tax=Escherichia coli TaxID=562 RepID=UPI000BE59726|nr:hypothetical protein [Escherichia coli]
MKGLLSVLFALMLCCGLLSVCDVIAANSATINIPVTIITQQSTCKVRFEGESVSGDTYTFQKVLLKGVQQKHPSFQAVVYCDDNSVVTTALALRPAGALQSVGNKVGLYRVDEPGTKSGELWLTLKDGSIVPMGKNAADATQKSFCQGGASNIQHNICLLMPVTDIPVSAVGGPVNTTLAFDVVYP